MVEYPIIDGDIFESDADVIVHQVNCRGKMGSGIAKQVRDKFPNVFQEYKRLCDEFSDHPSGLLGCVQYCYKKDYPVGKVEDEQIIANLFAQDSYGYGGQYTDYIALGHCFEVLNRDCKESKIAIPYRMSCVRGGGKWSTVLEIIKKTLTDCEVVFYRFNSG